LRVCLTAHSVCPACGATGVLEGGEVLLAERHVEQVDEEDFDVWMDLTIGAEHFSCAACRLILDRQEFLHEAVLPSEFADTRWAVLMAAGGQNLVALDTGAGATSR